MKVVEIDGIVQGDEAGVGSGDGAVNPLPLHYD
jgi:hypothetical protein